MSKFKAVLFDWEGVIAPNDTRPFGWLMGRLIREYSVDESTTVDALLGAIPEFMCGNIDNRTFWYQVGNKLGVTFSEEFQDTIWGEWHGAEALPEMRELVAYVKERGLKAVVLSNILPTSAEQIRKRGGYDMFDAEVLSCVEGIRKPDPAIYQKTVELAGCLPEECIFIEDQERYIVPAKEMGITTILATSPEQIIRDLKALIG